MPVKEMNMKMTRANAGLLVAWFHSVYERPEEGTPRDDGEWVWICGGPYHLEVELTRPPGFTDEEREVAAALICEDPEYDGVWEWARQSFSPYFQGAPPEPLFPEPLRR